MSVIVKGGGGGKTGGLYVWKKYENIPCLAFTGNEDFTLKTANTTKNWDGTLEYSTDKSTWNVWDGTEISSSGSKLYLRGIGNTVISAGVYGDPHCFVFTGTDTLKIACEGNIEYLLDYETVSSGGHPDIGVYCFSCLFRDCTSLVKAPALLSTTLTTYCYSEMFYGCTSLITAPEISATTLADYCCNSMFAGCTSLTTAPALPATTLANNCYYGMFVACISLTTIPALPATTLPDYCYGLMFNSCPNIKLSTTQTDEYQTAYRIPMSGTGTILNDASIAVYEMFGSTGGTFTGTPEINTTYYTSNTVV